MSGGAVMTGGIANLLKPGLLRIFGQSYMLAEKQRQLLFEEINSKKNAEELQQMTDIGLLTQKDQAEAITFDQFSQSFFKRSIPITRALGLIISLEARMDNLYAGQIKRGGKLLAESAAYTRELVAHNVLNNGFDNTYTGPDGLELFSTAHLHKAGGTWQNEPTVDADFSQAAVEQAIIDMGGWTTDKGKKMRVSPVSIHGPVDLMFEFKRVLGSDKESGTANNDMNAVKGLFPKGWHTHQLLTDTDAWFIKTNQDGLIFNNRMNDTISSDSEFLTENLMFKVLGRYDATWYDPHSVYGSQGV